VLKATPKNKSRKDEYLMNKTIIEMITFQIKKEVSEEHLLKVFHALNKVLQNDIDGFIKRSLIKECTGDNWVELIWWNSMDAAQAALENLPQYAEFQQYCSVMKEDGMTMIYLEEKA